MKNLRMKNRRDVPPPAKRRRTKEAINEWNIVDTVISAKFDMYREEPKELSISSSELEMDELYETKQDYVPNGFDNPSFESQNVSLDDSVSRDVTYVKSAAGLPELTDVILRTDQSFEQFAMSNFDKRDEHLSSVSDNFVDNILACPDFSSDVSPEQEVPSDSSKDCSDEKGSSECVKNSEKPKKPKCKKLRRFKKLTSLMCCLSI